MIFFILVLIAYCFLMLLLIAGWNVSFTTQKSHQNGVPESITVIIPVRNEERTIEELLNDLSRQHFKAHEIIVVDDHSTDNTADIVRKRMKADGTITFLKLDEDEGKKRALDIGIRHAKTALIATTDGDCRVGPSWLQSIVLLFNGETLKMVTGGVRLVQETSLFSEMQSLETSALIGVGAATLVWGFPTMCNGANLAFRKDVFEEVKGYEGNFHIASGDDEFLMRKVAAKYPHGVKYNKDANSVVTTWAQRSFRDFFYQRLRWASKWRSHAELSGSILAIGIFLVHVSTCILVVTTFTGAFDPRILLVTLLIKAALEYIYLRKIMEFLAMPWRWIPFLLWQVLYSPYAICFGILSTIIPYHWKGRKLHLQDFIFV